MVGICGRAITLSLPRPDEPPLGSSLARESTLVLFLPPADFLF